MSVTVRIPVGAEQQACRMLLPAMAADPLWTDFRIATEGTPPRVAGAVAATPVIDTDGSVALRIALRVPRPLRRQGLGRAIIEAVASEARSRVARLLVRLDGDTNPAAWPFLAACGFELAERQVFLAADYSLARGRLLALYARLQARGAIPASARVVPLGEAPLAPLVELHVALVGGTSAGIAAQLQARRNAGARDDSIVLLVNEVPAGLLLFDTRAGVTRIATRLVSPSLQAAGLGSGWPNVMLLAEGCRRADRRSTHTLRFDCRESNRDTMRLVRHLDATIEQQAEVYARRLGAA